MKLHLRVFVLIGVLSILAGCGDGVQSESVVIEDAPAETVLARVAGEPITCGAFRKRLDFEMALYKCKKGALPNYERRAEAHRFDRFQRVLPTLVNQALLDRSAKDNGVKLSDERLAAAVKKLARSLGFKGDPRAFPETVGVDYSYCAKAAVQHELIQEIRDRLYPQASIVTSQEIDEGLARLDRYFIESTASNKVVYSTCSNVFHQIQQGADFIALAERVSIRGREEAECWGEFLSAEIDDAKLREWAFSAPIGSLAIFDIEDGLAIVRIHGRETLDGAKEGESPAVKAEEGEDVSELQVKLGRILFEMLETEPEPRTREHVENEMRKWKKNEAQKSMFDDLMKRYEVTYPHGNVFKLRRNDK